MTAPSPWVDYTWEGVDGWLWQGSVFIPYDFDPTTGGGAIFIAPPGGRGAFPGPGQGAPGPPCPPSSVTVNQVAPGGTIPAPVVDVVNPITGQWNLTFWVYSGAPGEAAPIAILTAVDLNGVNTAQLGDLSTYVPAANGNPAEVTFIPALSGGKWWPSTINSTTSANGPQRTLCQVSIPAQRFAYFPKVSGGAVVSGTGPNVQVNLVARLNSTTGSDIGVGVGIAGQAPQAITVWDGPPAGSTSPYGQVAANAGATIFLQAEQQSGTDSFTTSASTTRFSVTLERIS